MTLKDCLQHACNRLSEVSHTPRLDAELLFSFALKKNRGFLYSYPEKTLSKPLVDKLNLLVAERAKGIPIAYITGVKEFWSLTLKVTKDTLIPRPETEILVEQALYFLKSLKNPIIFDLGTGSGAIAIAIAKERPDAKIFASDISATTLKIAKDNALHHQLTNIRFFQSNWFEHLETKKAHLIISNPPYIKEGCPHLEHAVQRFEPALALISKDEGLFDLKTIIQQAPQFLYDKGSLLLEFGSEQHPKVEKEMQRKGYKNIRLFNDLQNHVRAIQGIKP